MLMEGLDGRSDCDIGLTIGSDRNGEMSDHFRHRLYSVAVASAATDGTAHHCLTNRHSCPRVQPDAVQQR
jgi:hypothetical protein